MYASAAITRPSVDPGLPVAHKALNRLLRLKPAFALHQRYSPQRPALEAYIGKQFQRAYGATITEYLPALSSMQCQGRTSAVAGIRPAHGCDLFVERYLHEPIEQMLSRHSPTGVDRSAIVEIGNLSATHRGATLLFFIVQITMLQEAGFDWAAFTATDQVEKIINKLNFVTLDLGPADPARLGSEAARWGRYYDTEPSVCAIDIVATVARLRRSPLPAAVIMCFKETIAELAQSMKSGGANE